MGYRKLSAGIYKQFQKLTAMDLTNIAYDAVNDGIYTAEVWETICGSTLYQRGEEILDNIYNNTGVTIVLKP